MKRIQLVVLAPIVIGLGLLIGGMASGISALSYAGIAVLFGGSFLCALIISIVVIVKAVKNTDGKKTVERERTQINKINSSVDTEREIESTKKQLTDAASTYKSASRKDKAKGCAFVLSFLGCAVVGMVLLSCDLIVPGLVLFGCSFAIIIGAAIISSSAQHRSLSRHYNPADYIQKRAKVCDCNTASTTTVNGRVTKTVYRVTVEADGVRYDAYSLFYCNIGAPIDVLIHKNGKIVKILDTVISDGDGYDDYENADRASAYDYFDEFEDVEDTDDYDEENDYDDEPGEGDDEQEGDGEIDYIDEAPKAKKPVRDEDDRDGERPEREKKSRRKNAVERLEREKSERKALKPNAREEQPIDEPPEAPDMTAKNTDLDADIEKATGEPESSPVTPAPAPTSTGDGVADTKKPNPGYKGIKRKK